MGSGKSKKKKKSEMRPLSSKLSPRWTIRDIEDMCLHFVLGAKEEVERLRTRTTKTETVLGQIGRF